MPPDQTNRSRRNLLAALPAVALAGVACTTGTPTTGVPTAGTPTAGDTEPSALPAAPQPATPAEALQILLDGNARFAARTPAIRDTAQIDAVWSGGIARMQAPFATVLGCADSRLAPEILFDQFVGDIFVVREAGNIAHSPTNLGSLEYGQAVLGSKVLVVLGHSDCGAVKAAYDDPREGGPGGNIAAILAAIRPGIVGSADLDAAVIRNVGAVVDHIRGNSPLLAGAEKDGTLVIAGAVYDIKTATVRLL